MGAARSIFGQYLAAFSETQHAKASIPGRGGALPGILRAAGNAPGGTATLRSKSYIFLLLVLILGIGSGFLYSRTKYRLGLDIQGGVRFTYQMDQSQLKAAQKENLESMRARLLNIMLRRASGDLGVSEPQVVPKGDDSIIVELPGFTDVEAAKKVMGTSARIEFYDAKTVTTERNGMRPYVALEEEKDKSHPSVSFTSKYGDQTPIRAGSPEYKQIVKSWGLPLAAGDDLISADGVQRGAGMYEPQMRFSAKAGANLSEFSRRYANQKEKIAAVLDGEVLSIASLEDNTILNQDVVITGSFTPEYVRTLTNLLNSGALPVDLKLQSSEKVDPTIGSHALDRIISGGVIAFAVISVFLIAYYSFPGFVAFIALCLYVLFTLTVNKLINATFSLAGIAGFILSVGMAVDANILVFERFKEEMRHGKSLSGAIELGFRRALPAIIDSNACTILTSLVLANLGTGPVKGFATTLIIGVLVSLFTAVTVTRSLLMFFVNSGIADHPKWFAVDRNWFGKRLDHEANTNPLQIVNKPTKWFVISAVTILISIPCFFMGGFKPNVEFQGGYEAVFTVKDPSLSGAVLQANLEKAGMKGGNVKLGDVPASATVPAHRVAYISLPRQAGLSESDSASSLNKIALSAGVPADPSAQFTQVGPAVQEETRNNAILGVLLSSGLIILYLAFRFGMGVGGFTAGLRFGLSAIGALIHDILVVFGSAAILGLIFGWEVSALFLTAMLTMIGFSVHDTIVIFDRIRENLHHPLPDEDFGNLVNRSITQSFARSINTSMTVIVTLLILVFYGTTTPDLKFFVSAMLVGIVSGTYSSIYNASPILYLWDKAIGKKNPENTLVALARTDIRRGQMVHQGGGGASATVAAAVTPVEEPGTTNPSTKPQTGNRSYGQVRRRANAPDHRHRDIEE